MTKQTKIPLPPEGIGEGIPEGIGETGNGSLIERAVNAYATLQRTMAEGAGAAGLAAMLAAPERFHGKRVGLVLCGGNIDARILASVMVRVTPSTAMPRSSSCLSTRRSTWATSAGS